MEKNLEMAEDKVARVSTEVSESEKMQELKRKLIVDDIFVCIPRSPSNYILGPCFKIVFSPELSPHYPLAEGEKLLLHSAEPDWFKDKPLKSWPNVSRSWIDWVDRVEKEKREVWKSAGIYDAIQLSKHDIQMDKNLLYAALCYWSISTNSFHFRFGMMGPTVLDIVALTGLRPHGDDVSVPLRTTKLASDFPRYQKMKECSTYCKFLDMSMGAVPVTEEEHISFLVMWLCKYFFCNSSIIMFDQYTKLALALAKGRKLALAPLVMSNLYHGCRDIVTGKFDYARGPFWILQLWLQAYFPEHQPFISVDGNPPTYGQALADGVLRPKTFNQYFLFFNKCSSRTASQFRPFSARKFGPEWFKRSLDPFFQKLNSPELKDIWASYLIARDIPYCIVPDESSKCKCGVEHYSPNQFARQFGMTQAIPFHQTDNESMFSQLVRKFSFVPFNVNPSSIEFFDSWWSTYINNRDKTTTATDALRKISHCVTTPLGPSERQEGQKMKRTSEGDGVPSKSCVQQDDSRQQRNSSEAAELIPTRTACKKMKTSAGTTPAAEDGSKAAEQVYADDSSISGSSSASEKEGEECTVNRPNCPVDLDNLDEFFARVIGKIKQAEHLGFSDPVDGKTSVTQKSPPSVEMLATAKNEIERLLSLPSKDLLLPENCSMLNDALSTYTTSPDLPVERALTLEKLKTNLPQLSSSYRRAQDDKEHYYKKVAKKFLLVDDLTKGNEHYSTLKGYSDKLQSTMDTIRNQIHTLKASLKEAKMKRKSIQDQKLDLAKKCFDKSCVLDQMEAEFPIMEEMKSLADSDISRVEETLRELKNNIMK